MNKSNFVRYLVTTVIFSLAITRYANAQGDGIIPDNGPMCPEGHECHYIMTSGVYVDKTADSRVNMGCMGRTGVYNSDLESGVESEE
jgi:hypothetical protein